MSYVTINNCNNVGGVFVRDPETNLSTTDGFQHP